MKTTINTTFKVLGLILLAIAISLLFLAVMQFAHPLLASVGWHDSPASAGTDNYKGLLGNCSQKAFVLPDKSGNCY